MGVEVVAMGAQPPPCAHEAATVNTVGRSMQPEIQLLSHLCPLFLATRPTHTSQSNDMAYSSHLNLDFNLIYILEC